MASESGEAEKSGSSSDTLLREMKAMMEGLSAQVVGVTEDIGAVRNDLSQKISEGKAATKELRKRMDDNDKNFAIKVAAVVAGLPSNVPGADGLPVLGLSLIHI